LKFKSKDIAIIIPTSGNKNIYKVLNSIKGQSKKVGKIIIISNVKNFNYSLKNLKFFFTKKKNQVYQRILAKEFINSKTKIVLQLDDYVLLHKKAIEQLIINWNVSDEKIAGIGMMPTNYELPKPNLLQKILLTNSSIPGRVLKSGYVSAWGNHTKTSKVEWLNGGCVSWRLDFCKDLFIRKYPMIHWSVAEDLIYSFNKNRNYDLIISKNSKVKYIKREKDHNVNIQKSFQRGYLHSKIIKNFVLNDIRLSLLCYYYATILSSLIGIFISIFKININKLFLYSGRLVGGITKTYKYKIK
jgi:hypothetical protein